MDDDQLDAELRRRAADAMARRAESVDPDADRAALEQRIAASGASAVTSRPRSSRRLLAAALVLFFVGSIVAAIAFWQRDDGSVVVDRLPGTTTPSTPVATTEPTPSTSPDTTEATRSTTSTTSTTDAPVDTDATTSSISTTGSTVASSPPSTDPDVVTASTIIAPVLCREAPVAPPSLVDGSPTGEVTVTTVEGGSQLARWGAADSPSAVFQVLDGEVDLSWFEANPELIVARGSFEAVAIPVADPPAGPITIYVRDATTGCAQAYGVGPGLLVDEARRVATAWVEALAAGSAVEPPASTRTSAGFVGRRITEAAPFLALDRFDADGQLTGTLSADELRALVAPPPLPDGSVVTLDGERPQGRCENVPLTRATDGVGAPLHPDLAAARSFGVTADGVVIAARDVCPDGTRWGDDGTSWELVALDVAAATPTVETLLSRPSDPAAIEFDDGTRVIAMGEMLVEDISPDGRYVGLRDLHIVDQWRFHVVDRTAPGSVLAIESSCVAAGDIVGPPRFLDDDTVVIARVCATETPADPLAAIPFGDGDVQVEAVDLDRPAGEQVRWHTSVAGVGPHAFNRSVGLSALAGSADAPVAILTAGGDIEASTRSFVLADDTSTEITKPGYTAFAFDPADLIEPWDTLD